MPVAIGNHPLRLCRGPRQLRASPPTPVCELQPTTRPTRTATLLLRRTHQRCSARHGQRSPPLGPLSFTRLPAACSRTPGPPRRLLLHVCCLLLHALQHAVHPAWYPWVLRVHHPAQPRCPAGLGAGAADARAQLLLRGLQAHQGYPSPAGGQAGRQAVRWSACAHCSLQAHQGYPGPAGGRACHLCPLGLQPDRM